MIQRIQSLLLLGAAVCFGVACFVPIGMYGNDMEYTSWMLKNVHSDQVYCVTYVGLLQVILTVISFAAIFFYKNRPLQSKICTATIIIGFILLVVMLYVYPDHVFPKIIGDAQITYHIHWAMLSILPVGLLYLANKFILKDERKVRAADRLR